MAVVGGTTNELTGGKFTNGAVTGAFVHLFNDWAEDYRNAVNSNIMRNEYYKKIDEENARRFFNDMKRDVIHGLHVANDFSSAMAAVSTAEGGLESYFWDIMAMGTEGILLIIGEQGAITSTVNNINGAIIDTMTPDTGAGKATGTILKEVVKVK